MSTNQSPNINLSGTTPITELTPVNSQDAGTLSHTDIDKLKQTEGKKIQKLMVKTVQSQMELALIIVKMHSILAKKGRASEFSQWCRSFGISRSHAYSLRTTFNTFYRYPHIANFGPTALLKISAGPAQAVTEAKRIVEEEQRFVDLPKAMELIRRFSPQTERPKTEKIEVEGISATIVLHGLRGCEKKELTDLKTAIENLLTKIAKKESQ